MSRIMIFLTVAVVLFGGAAGLSWYLQYQPLDAEHVKDSEEKGKKSSGKTAATKKDAADLKGGALLIDNPEARKYAQASATLQIREETIKQREQHLVIREKQLGAIHEDIKKEHAKLEGVRKDVQAELNNVNRKLGELELRTAELSKGKRDLAALKEKVEGLTKNVTQVEAKNLKQLAGICDKMEPDAAAVLLNQYFETGKVDDAASILYFMKAPQSAAVLAELSKQDPSVSAKLLERMQNVNQLIPTANK